MTRPRGGGDKRAELATCEPFLRCTDDDLDRLQDAVIDDVWVEPGVSIAAESDPDVVWLVCAGAVAVRHDERVSVVPAGQSVSPAGPIESLDSPTGAESAWLVRFVPEALIEIDNVSAMARACARRDRAGVAS